MGKNWNWSYQVGRERRIRAEINKIEGRCSSIEPGLHSHDATMQSFYVKGWASISMADVFREHAAQQGRTPPKPQRNNKEYPWNH